MAEVLACLGDQVGCVLLKTERRVEENGTGIGVFYAKRFIEDLGGRLSIESSLGEGTVVSLYIPNTQKDFERRSEDSDNQLSANS